jgi:uncharacterized protein YciI
MNTGLFLVNEIHGPQYQSNKPLEEQEEWNAHAGFMDALAAEGFVQLGGPIVGTPDVLLIIRARDEAEIRNRLAADPWQKNGLLRIVSIKAWQLRLGKLSVKG